MTAQRESRLSPLPPRVYRDVWHMGHPCCLFRFLYFKRRVDNVQSAGVTRQHAAPEEFQRLSAAPFAPPDFVTYGIWYSLFLLPLPANFRPELTYTRNGVRHPAAPVESRSTDHSAQSSVIDVE